MRRSRPTGRAAAALEPSSSRASRKPAIDAAPLRVDAEYVQPARHHNPMEPSATLALWEGDRLTIYDATQYVTGVQTTMASLFGIEPAQIRVIAQHTGGGFGCKGWVWPHQPLAAAAARIVGRPVKIVLTRAEMYSTVGYQPHIRQAMTLAADQAGALAVRPPRGRELVGRAGRMDRAGHPRVERPLCDAIASRPRRRSSA